MTDSTGVVKEYFHIREAEVLTIGVDRSDLATAHTEIDPVIAADRLRETAADVRPLVDGSGVEDVDVVDGYSFVGGGGVTAHDDPEPDVRGIHRDQVARHMPFGIGHLPGLVERVIIPVGTAGDGAELDPVDAIDAVFGPVIVAGAVVFGLKDMAEGKLRL